MIICFKNEPRIDLDIFHERENPYHLLPANAGFVNTEKYLSTRYKIGVNRNDWHILVDRIVRDHLNRRDIFLINIGNIDIKSLHSGYL